MANGFVKIFIIEDVGSSTFITLLVCWWIIKLNLELSLPHNVPHFEPNSIAVLPHVLPCESSCALAVRCRREWRQLFSEPWPLDGFIKPDLVVVRWFNPPPKKTNTHLYQTQPPLFVSTSALFDPVPRLSLELSLFSYLTAILRH